jgi:hypothetical protein
MEWALIIVAIILIVGVIAGLFYYFTRPRVPLSLLLPITTDTTAQQAAQAAAQAAAQQAAAQQAATQAAAAPAQPDMYITNDPPASDIRHVNGGWSSPSGPIYRVYPLVKYIELVKDTPTHTGTFSITSITVFDIGGDRAHPPPPIPTSAIESLVNADNAPVSQAMINPTAYVPSTVATKLVLTLKDHPRYADGTPISSIDIKLDLARPSDALGATLNTYDAHKRLLSSQALSDFFMQTFDYVTYVGRVVS